MRWSARLAFLLLFASPLYGQGMRYDNFVLKPLAAGGVTPVSGALITVCTSAGTGTPCTPKVANIYSDEALTVPITGSGGAGTTNSDANGNFGFYAAPGSYIATVTGSGITSYTIKVMLPLGTSAGSSTSATNATNLVGPGTVSGVYTHNAMETFTGATNSNTLNNVVWVGCSGCLYQTVTAGIAALPSTGGLVYTVPGYRETFTSAITIGGAAKPVTLILAPDTILTDNVTGGVCAIEIKADSSLQGNTVPGGASNQGASTVAVASTANNSAVICSDQTASAPTFSLRGITIAGNGSATISSAVIDLQAVTNPSRISDTLVFSFGSTKLMRLRNKSGASFGPFLCDNCWLQGQGVAGVTPLSIESVTGGGLMANITFLGGLINRSGTGLPEVNIDGSAVASSILGVKFLGVYMENAFAGSNAYNIKDAQAVTIIGTVLAGTGGTDAVNISQSASSRTFNIIVENLRDQIGFTNLINDTVNSVTIASAVNSGSLLSYMSDSPNLATAGMDLAANLRVRKGSYLVETATVPTAVAGQDVCYGDSTAHAPKCSFNNGFFLQMPQVIASGTTTLTANATLAAVTSQAVNTTAATGVLTTDAIEWSYASAPGAGDSLCHVSPYATAGNVNFVRTNPTAAAQNVSAIVINWRVIR